MPLPSPRPRFRAFTLIELLVVIAIIGILVALLLPAVQKVRDAASRLRCQNNLKQLSLACHLYHNANGKLPPAVQMKLSGTPKVSDMSKAEGQPFGPNWIVLVLPYIEQGNLYDTVGPSINSYMDDGNTDWRAIRGETLKGLICSSESDYTSRLWPGITGFADWGRGNYGCNAFGIHQNKTGSNTSISGNGWQSTRDGASPVADEKPPDGDPGVPVGTRGGGVMCINWGATLNAIPDGAANTVMLAELRNGGAAGPNDVRGTWALGMPGASVVAAHASWDCRTPNNSHKDDRSDDIGPGGANRPEIGMGACENCAFQQAQSRSRHTGGVTVAMCDGSVRFVRNSISQPAWWCLNARDDGLTLTE